MTLPFLLVHTQDLMISEGDEEEEHEEYEAENEHEDVINTDKEYSYQNEIVNTSLLSFPSESSNEKFNPWKSNEKSSNINMSSSSSSSSKLDDVSVASILKYIEKHKLHLKSARSKSKRQVLSSQSQSLRTYPLPLEISSALSSSSYGIGHSGLLEPGLFDKFATSLGIMTKDMVINMKKVDYISYGITIAIIVGKCRIPISNMYKAGIVNNLQDLIDLKFTLDDLTINTDLFSVGHLVQLYGVNYYTLVENDNIGFTFQDLLKFNLFELQTLSFNFDDFIITRKCMAKRHFEELYQNGFTFSHFKTLGLTADHLRKFNITRNEALFKYKWTEYEYKSLS